MGKTDQQLQILPREGTGALEEVPPQHAQSGETAAAGPLAANIADEITNPVTLIFSGLPSLTRDLEKLMALIPEEKRDDRFAKVSRRVAGLLEAIGDGAERAVATIEELRSISRRHDLDETRRWDELEGRAG